MMAMSRTMNIKDSYTQLRCRHTKGLKAFVDINDNLMYLHCGQCNKVFIEDGKHKVIVPPETIFKPNVNDSNLLSFSAEKEFNFKTPLRLTLWTMTMYAMGIWLGHNIANKHNFLFSAIFSVLFYGLLFFIASLIIENKT
jgi:hypothetical protein